MLNNRLSRWLTNTFGKFWTFVFQATIISAILTISADLLISKKNISLKKETKNLPIKVLQDNTWSDFTKKYSFLGINHHDKIQRALELYGNRYNKKYYLMPMDSITVWENSSGKVVSIDYKCLCFRQFVSIRVNKIFFDLFYKYTIDSVAPIVLRKKKEILKQSISQDTIMIPIMKLRSVIRNQTLSTILSNNCPKDQDSIITRMRKENFRVNKIFKFEKYCFYYDNNTNNLKFFLYKKYIGRGKYKWFIWYKSDQNKVTVISLPYKPKKIITKWIKI